MSKKQAQYGQPAVYNATAPTLTDGDNSALNVDSSGGLLLSGAGAGAATAPTAAVVSGAVYNSTPPTYTNGQLTQNQSDVNGNQLVSEATAHAGEDIVNDVQKVEQRFTTSGVLLSDTPVKSGVGVLHSITISQNDAAPTAGTIDILDSTAAGAGVKLFTWTLTTAVFTPFTVIIDASFTLGLYADFTTTADVAVFLSYR